MPSKCFHLYVCIKYHYIYYSCSIAAGVPSWFPDYYTTHVLGYTTHRSLVRVEYMHFR